MIYAKRVIDLYRVCEALDLSLMCKYSGPLDVYVEHDELHGTYDVVLSEVVDTARVDGKQVWEYYSEPVVRRRVSGLYFKRKATGERLTIKAAMREYNGRKAVEPQPVHG
jgi:hypothetical protein